MVKATLAEKQTGLSALAFSPDGRLLATNHDGVIKLWGMPVATDFQSADIQLRQTLPGHHTIARCIAFAPGGATLASGAEEGDIKLWSLADGKTKTLIGHTEKVTALAFSPDGRTLVSAGFDGQIRLWNPRTEKELGLLEGHAGPIHTLAFSPDGTILASGGEAANARGEIFVWRLPR